MEGARPVEHLCRIYVHVHAKTSVVDGHWLLFGYDEQIRKGRISHFAEPCISSPRAIWSVPPAAVQPLPINGGVAADFRSYRFIDCITANPGPETASMVLPSALVAWTFPQSGSMSIRPELGVLGV